jgi:hypothetical protein
MDTRTGLPPLANADFGISSLYNGSSHDRVIDLSVNKSVSSEESEDNESKGGNSIRSKSPPMSETESEEKRHVTTTIM